jgi:Carboxypeptidase regulatory-like domain
MRYRYWKAIVLSLVIVGVCRAQQVTGDLLVNLTDSSGSAVPAATLTLTQNSTSLKFVTTSDDLGNALYPQLQPGIYTLSVSKPGFQPQSIKDILIQVGHQRWLAYGDGDSLRRPGDTAERGERLGRPGDLAEADRRSAAQRPEFHSAGAAIIRRCSAGHRRLARHQLDRTRRHDAFSRGPARVQRQLPGERD